MITHCARVYRNGRCVGDGYWQPEFPWAEIIWRVEYYTCFGDRS